MKANDTITNLEKAANFYAEQAYAEASRNGYATVATLKKRNQALKALKEAKAKEASEPSLF